VHTLDERRGGRRVGRQPILGQLEGQQPRIGLVVDERLLCSPGEIGVGERVGVCGKTTGAIAIPTISGETDR